MARRSIHDQTVLLTDIEASTRLVQRLGDRYAEVLARHHHLLRAAIAAHGGSEVATEGDSFFVVFDEPQAALRAAVAAQRALTEASWPSGEHVAVRMGLHLGPLMISDGEYVGLELHRAARISGVAHGGQIVISAALRDAIGPDLPEGTALRTLGEHRLKDFDEPVGIFQVDVQGLRTEFPPLTSLSARFDLMPSELSSFVGRETEVGAIGALLAGSRLVTLVGPGGTGKSRLAQEVARQSRETWDHGLAYVALASVTEPALVAPTVRGTLGFAEEPGRRSVDTLITKLRRHRMLLILDNYEQVLDARAFVAELLAGTERLAVLVTSRAALHVEGEQEFPVPPMAIPIIGSDVSPSDIADNDSVRLFVDRAGQVRPGFELDSGNAVAVARICQRLEGLPLAIELAAARIGLMPPQALLPRLSNRLDVLDGRGASDRRRTLRGTIAWSHDLLASDEQVLFRRLSVFQGGAGLEAIEGLATRVEGAGTPVVSAVLDALAALIDHSLVRSLGAAGEPRYAMLETIREYGLERLKEAGEHDALSAAHAAWFLGRVHDLAPTFTADPEALDEVEADHADVRAALQFLMAQGDTQGALLGVADLWRFWHLRGHLREGLAVCEEVGAMPGADAPTGAAAGARYAHASLLYWQGRTEEALEGYRASLEMARAAGSRPREAEAQFALAYALGIAHDWEAAHEAAQSAERIYLELGDSLGATNARFTDAYMSSLSGAWEAAAAQLIEIQPAVEATGDRFWWLSHRIVLAWTLTRLGRIDESREILQESLQGSIELGDRSSEHMVMAALAAIAALEGDQGRALLLAGVAEAIAASLGGQAPAELVIGLDAVELAREHGVSADEAVARVAEGRSLSIAAARELAREVADRR